MKNKRKDLLNFINETYNLQAQKITKIAHGTGGDVFIVSQKSKKYIVKLSIEDKFNHPNQEPLICEALLNKKIPTMKFLKNIDNKYTSKYDDRFVNVYRYINGNTFSHNEMPKEIVDKCIEMLARMQEQLRKFNLETGIGEDFFKYMTIDRAKKSYEKSLECARKSDEKEIIDNLLFRMKLLDYFEDYEIDHTKLTYRNSHGDFTNNQIIVNDKNKIRIIDFTCACKHPVIWEITRFFFHSDMSVKNGCFSYNRFQEYVEKYTKIIPLSEYETKHLIIFYFYQILVCDYYSQYYSERDKDKKKDYLIQANFASTILKENEHLIINNFLAFK